MKPTYTHNTRCLCGHGANTHEKSGRCLAVAWNMRTGKIRECKCTELRDKESADMGVKIGGTI